MRRRTRCRDDHGAIELFVIVVVLALIVALGIVVDLGGKMRTDDRAAWTAQQAARVAASHVSGQIQGGTLPVLSGQGAVSAAQEVIAAAVTGFTAPLGQIGNVAVTCTDTLTSLPVLNLGDQTITRTGTSVVDPHRRRT